MWTQYTFQVSVRILETLFPLSHLQQDDLEHGVHLQKFRPNNREPTDAGRVQRHEEPYLLQRLWRQISRQVSLVGLEV